MKEIKQIQVFLASPGDVSNERQIVEETIEELNLTWGKPNNYNLYLETWEKSSYPGMGLDGQETINRQLNFDFDVFICIFWKKLGTPTGRAESGTIEELEIALKKRKTNPQIEIMGYFKEETVPFDEITE